MGQVHVIRHEALVGGRSARQVADGDLAQQVKRYLALAAPVRGEQEPRKRSVRGKVDARLLALLDESQRWTGGKQRLTEARLPEMVLAEGYSVGTTHASKHSHRTTSSSRRSVHRSIPRPSRRAPT